MRSKLTLQNYTINSKGYQLRLPLELSKYIPEDDSVKLLSHLLEELDYTMLYQAYSTKGRNPSVDPKIMFKILVYSYSQKIYSSHKIENACKRDINFMWLLSGQKAPDHSTIARFRKNHASGVIEKLFYEFNEILYQHGEIQYENAFIDGTKIESKANRYTFVWKKSTLKNEAKMHVKIHELIGTINYEYSSNFKFDIEKPVESMSPVLEMLSKEIKEKNISFVYGKGTRPSLIQKQFQELEEYIIRQKQYDEKNKTFKGRNSYSKTDIDATFMRMKEDHMKNGQLKPAYNIQIAVESEYVTGVGVFSDANDLNTLKPMIENMEKKSGHKYRNIIADSGYESEENYSFLEEKHQNSYIKPQNYEAKKKRKYSSDISKRENMRYSPEKDEYICSNNQILRFCGTRERKSKSGYISEISIYECETCLECSMKNACTKAKGNRRLEVSKEFLRLRENSLTRIESELGILLRVNRSIQVEGAFGVLKSDYQFSRFLTSGRDSVKNEFLLLCFGYNLNKLHNKIQKKKQQTHLHEVKVAA